MASNFKIPPAFDQKSMTYETWKNEIAVWQLVTDLQNEKQALVVSVSLWKCKGNGNGASSK
jgi:hypothetical protein